MAGMLEFHVIDRVPTWFIGNTVFRECNAGQIISGILATFTISSTNVINNNEICKS